MQIGHWPPRHLARWWAIGLGVEAILIVALMTWVRYAPREPLFPEGSTLGRAMAQTDSINRGLLPAPPPLSDSQRAALKQFVRDSLGLAITQRGDTVVVEAVTPEARALSDQFQQGMRALGNVLAIAAVFFAAVYLTIPLTLITLTGIWLWQRRRRGELAVADV